MSQRLNELKLVFHTIYHYQRSIFNILIIEGGTSVQSLPYNKTWIAVSETGLHSEIRFAKLFMTCHSRVEPNRVIQLLHSQRTSWTEPEFVIYTVRTFRGRAASLLFESLKRNSFFHSFLIRINIELLRILLY